MQRVNTVTMQEASKMLEEGPKILYRKLRKAGVLIDGTGLHNQARHQYVKQGYFVIEIASHTRGDVLHHSSKTLVTPSGLAFIRQVLDQQHAPEATNDQCNQTMGDMANASPQT
jgi:phage antirepressor YoqD-like protein